MNERILVVEDDPAILTGLRDLLESEGYAVETARDGAVALERFRAARPDLVVVEPCSINDWIEGLGPDESRRRTCETFARISALGARALLLTVSPIAGEQIRNGFNYGDYIAASREAASACGVPIADANAKMTKLLAGLNPSEARKLLYSDDWHVNALGHRLYAEEIIGLRLI